MTYKIDTCYSHWHSALKEQDKDWLAQRQANMAAYDIESCFLVAGGLVSQYVSTIKLPPVHTVISRYPS